MTTPEPLTRLDLLKALDEAYGDGGLALHYDEQTGKRIARYYNPRGKRDWFGVMIPAGDTLAAYIVAEVGDAWVGQPNGPTKVPGEVIDSLISMLTTAEHDLQRCIQALHQLWDQYLEDESETEAKDVQPTTD